MNHDGDLPTDANAPAGHDAGVLPIDGRESAPLPVPAPDRESAPLPVETPQEEVPTETAAGNDELPIPSDDAAPPAEAPTPEPAPIPQLIETFDAAELRDNAPSGDEPLPDVPDAADLPPAELRAVLEALLLVATRPLTTTRLCGCLPGCSPAYLEGFLRGLSARFDHEQRGWELRFIANGWQLLTRRAYHAWVRQLERKELPSKLSRGALETLSIVAYKQPIARGAIEDIRGVQSGPVLRQLMDLKLVAVIGRDDHTLGRPLLYGTTDAFLHRFGLGRIEDLPRSHEFGA